MKLFRGVLREIANISFVVQKLITSKGPQCLQNVIKTSFVENNTKCGSRYN